MIPLDDAWARRRFVVCARPDALLSASARLLGEHLRDQAQARAPTKAGADA
jgi:hypothetical protein